MGTDYPDETESEELMSRALDYYLKRHEVVGKKLAHARTATQQSIGDLGQQQNQDDPQSVYAYESIWDSILDEFHGSGISEEEFQAIEKTLTLIPSLIRKYYDILVQEDQVLQDLITELGSPAYQKALQTISRLQANKDPLSGLEPGEFDLLVSSEAFKINPQSFLKNRD
jgi:hypothetical protein